jgi:hypothetical protein
MHRSILIGFLALASLVVSSTNVSALSYMYVPEKVRLMAADLVVVGKMNDVKQVQQSITGTLTITKTLRGDAKMKTAAMSWRDMSRFGGGKGHRNGQTGIWLLKKGRDGKYATGYPGNFVAIDQLKRVEQGLKEIDQLKWVESNGLELTCITEMRKIGPGRAGLNPGQAQPVASLAIYSFVRNASKKAISVYDNQNDKIIGLTLVTPSGGERVVDLYPRFNPKMKLHARMFHTLEPGKMRALGYGQHVRDITQAGTHVMKLSYQNKHDGKALDVKDVWTGKINLKPIKIATPGSEKKAAAGS